MSDDVKIQRVQEGYQPRTNESTKTSLAFGQRSIGMDGHQPTQNEVTKGYRPTQPVDMTNLKIPKNLGDAAVMPRDSRSSVRASAEAKKE
jgi:hypothetical protein